MSEKTLRRILIAVVGIVAVYGIVAVMGNLGGDGSGVPESELELLLRELNPDAVDELLFIEEDTLRLARGDAGGWTVDGFRADSGRVARFWDALVESDAGRIVARNSSNHAALGVDEESATRLVIRRTDGATPEMLIGESGPTYPSAYVRLSGSDDVHLLESDLAVSVRQSVTTWRDHTIARVDTSRVRVVESTLPDGGGYTLERRGDGSGGWTVDGEPADRTQVRNVVGGLARVLAAAFVDPGSPRYDSVFPEPGSVDRRMVALDARGDTLVDLLVSGSEDDASYVRMPGDTTVYEIATFDVGRLFPDRDGLVASPAGDGQGG